MTHPMIGGGRRLRPARILIDDPALVQAVAPHLAEIDVRCEALAGSALINTALRNMDSHMNRRPAQPGLLSVKGATQPLVAELFEAAAEYHAQAPWRWMDNLAPLEIHYPADGPAHYLDAIETHGWPVAGANAYPLMMKVVPPIQIGAPSAAEMALLAAALRAIPDFLPRGPSLPGRVPGEDGHGPRSDLSLPVHLAQARRIRAGHGVYRAALSEQRTWIGG
ncbi:MAG: hypothetical protein FJ011_10350 [Chloroflexi bacterium]|nr:hypothetical protein [Chloroflexota bacterium]